MKGSLWWIVGGAYVLFAVIIPWLPGIDTQIFGISLRMHSAGNLTIGLLWLFLVLFLFMPRFRSIVLQKYYGLDNLSPLRIRRIIWSIAGIVFIISTSYKLRAHYNFQTHTSDLGLFATVCWNTLRGDIMWSSLLGANYFGVHFNPILIVLSLLFIFWENAAVLLIIQAAVIAVSIPALYEIGRVLKISVSYSIAMALLFISHPKIVKLLAFDFHPDVFIILWYSWAIVFWHKKKHILFSLMICGAFLVKEDIPLTLIGWGILILLTERTRWVSGISIMGAGLIFFVVTVGLIIPHYYAGSGISNLARYAAFGSSWVEIIRTILTQPIKVLITCFGSWERLYPLFTFFAGFGCAAVMAPKYLIPVAIGLFPHLLSGYDGQYRLSEIYVAASMPFLFLASLKGFLLLKNRFDSSVFKHVAFFCIFFLITVNFSRTTRFYKYVRSERIHAAHEMVKLIDPDASLLAQSDIFPHLVCRKNIQAFPRWKDIDTHIPIPDYIAVDGEGNSHPFTYEEWKQTYDEMRHAGEYEKLFDKEGYQLWKRK